MQQICAKHVTVGGKRYGMRLRHTLDPSTAPMWWDTRRPHPFSQMKSCVFSLLRVLQSSLTYQGLKSQNTLKPIPRHLPLVLIPLLAHLSSLLRPVLKMRAMKNGNAIYLAYTLIDYYNVGQKGKSVQNCRITKRDQLGRCPPR